MDNNDNIVPTVLKHTKDKTRIELAKFASKENIDVLMSIIERLEPCDAIRILLKTEDSEAIEEVLEDSEIVEKGIKSECISAQDMITLSRYTETVLEDNIEDATPKQVAKVIEEAKNDPTAMAEVVEVLEGQGAKVLEHVV